MNIEQLRHFSEIARCGSLNQATDALYISQPSLSASIKKLEQELGEPVFTRHSTGVSLTPFGEELLPYVRDVLSLLDQMPSQAFGKNAKMRPRLSVCSGAYRFTSWAVTHVYDKHQEDGIHIDYYDVSKEEALSMVSAGTAQVGCYGVFDFHKNYMLRRLDDLNVTFVPLAKAPVTVAVSSKNPLFDRKEDWVTLDMIKDYPVLYKFSEHSNSLQKKLGLSHGKSVLNCRTRAGRAELLSGTDCISVSAVPTVAYRKFPFYNDRRMFRLKDVDNTCEVGYIHRKGQSLPWLAQEFVDALKELFEE